MGAHDDLHGFDEESLLQALRAPGSSSELADEERYVTAFRASRGRRSNGGRAPSRLGGAARRFGAGTALAVVVGVSGGGVAAAYSGGLPDPLQDFAHTVLGPVGAPPAEREPRPPASAAPRSPASPATAPGTPTPSASEPTPTAPASPSPAPEPSKASKPSDGPGDRPSKDPTSTTSSSPDASPSPTPAAPPTSTPDASPSPTATPSSTPSSAPTSTPSPTAPSPSTPPLPPPAELTIEGGSQRVEVGQTTSISGVATAKDGKPIAGTEVVLQHRGSDGWRRVAATTTDDAGSVTFESAPVTETVVFRLRSAKVHSEPWRVVMRPLLALMSQTSSPEGSAESKATVVIAVSAVGGRAGDQVTLLTQRGGQRVTVGEGLLNEDGSIKFEVTQSKPQRTYFVVLARTPVHGVGRDSIRVTLPEDS